jgi:uncharacterized protein (DUF1015 family)
MADVQPLRTLRYDQTAVGSLEAVAAPPYDVIDAPMRAELAARSPFNVVEIDLPEANGADIYQHAQETLEEWIHQGIVVREREPALWVLTQDYTGPDGNSYTRHGFFARVRVEDYGAGRIRPHERTQPGPKEDRLNLTRATRANLSPIFSLFPDAGGEAWSALEPVTGEAPYATVTDADGTVNRLWRVSEPGTIERVRATLADRELLIADGHHRYETARVYAQEIGGEGEHNYVLMFLCALEDSGLTIFPTHRLLKGGSTTPEQQETLAGTLREAFTIEEIDADALEPPPAGPGAPVEFGYMDSHFKRPFRLTLKDQAVADRALEGHSDAYRRLDTAVLEALVFKGALGKTEDDVANKRGIDYSKSFADAREAVESGRADAAFFMRATPVEQVQEVAAAGESMPPKSTYFFPKIPTGLVFNALE